MPEPVIRPMTTDDVPFAEQISDDAFYALDVAERRTDDPPAQRRGEEGSARWIERTQSFVTTDPGGCVVADVDGEVVGFATSLRREQVWCLATFAVRPGLQGAGIGAALLSAAQEHGAGCPRGLLAASEDPRALRRYHRAGFTLHPQVTLRGDVDRARLRATDTYRDGTDDDLDWMDDLDRDLRGGPHGPDHLSLRRSARLVVAPDRTGYAYATPDAVQLLAARDEVRAADLLVHVLAEAPGRIDVAHVSPANLWAARVGLDLGLRMRSEGYLGVRGMAPPAPYLHHGAIL